MEFKHLMYAIISAFCILLLFFIIGCAIKSLSLIVFVFIFTFALACVTCVCPINDSYEDNFTEYEKELLGM